MTKAQQQILQALLDERAKQDQKWGPQNHPMGTGQRDDRHRANMAKIDCDAAHKHGHDTWRLILTEEFFEALAEPEGPELREELIQVMAVAMAMIECLDRRMGVV